MALDHGTRFDEMPFDETDGAKALPSLPTNALQHPKALL